MKDLIAKLQLDANCALGAIWMHIDAQAARIAELEAQQAFGIGETYANALSRIAELEAQIAAASAPSDTDKVREAVEAMNRAKLLPIWDNDVPHKLHVELDVIFKALSSMAAQAPVREVPEVTRFLDCAKAFAQAHVNSDAMDARVAADLDAGKYTVTEEEHEAMDDAYNTTKAELVAAYRALPAAPVQQEGE